jgi:hypothetical protein
MKKYFISGVLAIAISAVFTGCSKSTDLYDEGAIEKSKQEQKIADYNAAFEKAFGKIAVGNDWGFGAAKVTRASATSGYDQYDLTGLSKPINGKPKIDEFIRKFKEAPIATDCNFSDYFLQHVIKQTGKGKKGWGTKDQHHQMAQLQAFNYNTGEWEDVAHFTGGQSNKQLINGNNLTHGTTLMVNMGTPDNRPQFRWIAKKNAEVGEGYECTNYVIKKVEGQYYLGLSYVNKPENATNGPVEAYNNYDAWIIRLVKANGTPGYKEYGRVMCEDLGSTDASDFDFNDVVFDAWIMNDGSINIRVLAAGGILRPVTIGGVAVTLPTMCNTGGDVTSDPQEFTIPASVATKVENNWTTIASIPVVVTDADGQPIVLESKSDGSAPAKVCTAIGVPWAKERCKLDLAYTNWTSYVNTRNPDNWYTNMHRAYIVPLFFDETEIEGE